jgi:hypothetical protein
MRALCKLAFLVALCGLGASCSPFEETAPIADLTQTTIIKLVSSNPEKHVVSLQIRGAGSIDGTAQIELMLDGKPYRSEQLQGPVSFSWGGDWYSPTAEIRYRPSNVRGGKLSLDYRFGTL